MIAATAFAIVGLVVVAFLNRIRSSNRRRSTRVRHARKRIPQRILRKLVEYGLAVAYLILSSDSGASSTVERKREGRGRQGRRAARAVTAGWFELPADVALHPGHTWARMEKDGTVAVASTTSATG